MTEFGTFAYFVCGNGEVSGGFSWGNLRERKHLEDLDVEDMVILTFRCLTSTIVDVPHRKPLKLYFIYLFNKYRYCIF